jgi:CxxC-x17-CxxC domain-containing protein
MSDDDKTTTDEPTSDAAEEVTPEPAAETTEPEPEAEVKDEAQEQTTEPAAEEPKEEAAAADAPTPTAKPAGTDQQGRTLYNVKCTNCGKDTQVPFQPAAGRPVYCRDCYMQKKNS